MTSAKGERNKKKEKKQSLGPPAQQNQKETEGIQGRVGQAGSEEPHPQGHRERTQVALQKSRCFPHIPTFTPHQVLVLF